MLLESAVDIELTPILAHFRAHGYARLGPVLSAAGQQQLATRSVEIMTGERRYAEMFFQHDSGTGRYADLSYGKGWIGASLEYRKLERLELDDVFRAWIENTLFERIARTVLGNSISLYRAALWNKAAHAGTELPWHQDDGSFWGIDRSPCLQIWTAIDPAPTESGCIELLPRSHLHGLASPQGGTVQADRLQALNANEQAIKVPVAAGEALLIHNHVWHRSGRNSSEKPRRALGISFLDGATQCLRKRRAPREFVPLFTNRTVSDAPPVV